MTRRAVNEPEPSSHVFNAFYDGKKVYAVDGQDGSIRPWPPNYDDGDYRATEWRVYAPANSVPRHDTPETLAALPEIPQISVNFDDVLSAGGTADLSAGSVGRTRDTNTAHGSGGRTGPEGSGLDAVLRRGGRRGRVRRGRGVRRRSRCGWPEIVQVWVSGGRNERAWMIVSKGRKVGVHVRRFASVRVCRHGREGCCRCGIGQHRRGSRGWWVHR